MYVPVELGTNVGLLKDGYRPGIVVVILPHIVKSSNYNGYGPSRVLFCASIISKLVYKRGFRMAR